MSTSILRDLQRANRRIGPAIERRVADIGVREPEIHVMAHLAGHGSVPIGDLRRAFGIHRSTLTSALDRLVDRGLLERYPNPVDRRSTLVALTPAGALAADRVHETIEMLEAALRARLDEADVVGFERVVGVVDAVTGANSGRSPRPSGPGRESPR